MHPWKRTLIKRRIRDMTISQTEHLQSEDVFDENVDNDDVSVTQPKRKNRTSTEFEVKSNEKVGKIDSIRKTWRPALAYAVIAIILFDFIFFQIMTFAYAYWTATAYTPWVPYTLNGGGLFYMAMGAFLGVYAWGRTVEKKNGRDEG